MVPESSVQILGRPPFHDTQLTSSGDLAYVGGTWQRDVAFAGYSVPLAGDFPAQRMIDAVPGVDLARKERLIKVSNCLCFLMPSLGVVLWRQSKSLHTLLIMVGLFVRLV